MWNQACSQSPDGMSSHKAEKLQRTTHQILPCTVSQLLSASQGGNDVFAICDWELNQVSIVGIIRGLTPFVTNIQFSVDDMTGPPLNVMQWFNAEDCAPASPGTYVKVIGSLRSFNGRRSLLALNCRCIKDLNEITSHMLDVVHAHKQHFGKFVQAFDVNMNTTVASSSGGVLEQSEDWLLKVPLPNGLSTLQGQVLTVLRRFSSSYTGIAFPELQTQLDYLSPRDIRTSLTFLINEGHAFCTIDEHHFKSTDY